MSRQASMKDVAEKAGVSVGTVANVIKGDWRVSLSMVQRVQDAIRKTGYRAFTQQRTANKMRKTRSIGVILPSVQDSNFAGIFTGINHVLVENGYISSLCITSEIQAREQRAIEQFVKQRVEGIVIVTCQPDSTAMFQSVFDNGTPLVFLEREPDDGIFPFAEYNCAKNMTDLVAGLLAEGYTQPLLVIGPRENSSETAYEEGFLTTLDKANDAASRRLWVIETSFNKESAFSGIVARLSKHPLPDVIITTSGPLLSGALHATKLLALDHPPAFVSLGSDSWAPDLSTGVRILRRDSMKLGEAAASMLVGLLNGNDDNRKKQLVITDIRDFEDSKQTERKSIRLKAGKKSLRALMLAGSTCSAVESLLPAFRKSSGVDVEIDKRPLSEIGAMMRDPEKRGKYDIFQIDQPWLGEAVEEGLLLRLDSWFKQRPDLAQVWLPGVIDAYCCYDEHYYTVPFVFGTQLLFYRKDLFDDPTLRSTFRKNHKYDLRAPRNWREFNEIGAFFTRSINPGSPIEYGLTLGGQEPNGAVCEFMPRLLSYNNGEFGAENMLESLTSPEAEAALTNYIESYRYAPPGACDFWWDEQATYFSQGRAAMMILFLAHVSPLSDRQQSKVIGRIGYDIIPGGRPMLGGWTLGVNRMSPSRDSALEFLAWVSDQNLVIPLTILGGTPPANRVYHNSELCALYPWLPKGVESFSRRYERNISRVTTGGKVEERVFEDILGGAVHAAIIAKYTPAEALRQAREALEKLIASG